MTPSFSIEVLTLPQIRELYKSRMVQDFPANELKPLSMIERALARGEYAAYGALAEGEALAYAYFVLRQEEGPCFALLDYLAVKKELRGTGIGSRFLQGLITGPLAGMASALLEVDDPALAPDPKEKALRERRLRFYLRNGLNDTGVTARVFGAAFRVLALPIGPTPSRQETERMYEVLYRIMLPPRLYDANVFISCGQELKKEEGEGRR